jgi:hypothetical protein
MEEVGLFTVDDLVKGKLDISQVIPLQHKKYTRW